MIGMFDLKAGHTAADWENYFRDISSIYLTETNNNKIGAPGMTVEIDETKIFKSKNHTGRATNEQLRNEWLFGGICRETKKTFFLIVPDRTETTLMQLLQDNVELGTHVISDSWRSYWRISNYGYSHAMVNHSENFIDPSDENTHTQTIERTWRTLKENIPPSSRYNSRIRYIIQYSFKRRTNWYKLTSAQRFVLLLNLIANYY